MNLATRISRISVSKTMAVMEAAIKLRDQGIDVVDFGPGEPDFPTPENVKQAGIRAIQADFTKYTAIGGIKELKKAIVDKHAREFGSKYDVSEGSRGCAGYVMSNSSATNATRIFFMMDESRFPLPRTRISKATSSLPERFRKRTP